MVQTKRNQERVVVTNICFHGTGKIEGKLKVCVMENKGSVAKMMKMRGNNCNRDFKTALFVKYIGFMLTDFHETSGTGILLMRWSK